MKLHLIVRLMRKLVLMNKQTVGRMPSGKKKNMTERDMLMAKVAITH